VPSKGHLLRNKEDENGRGEETRRATSPWRCLSKRRAEESLEKYHRKGHQRKREERFGQKKAETFRAGKKAGRSKLNTLAEKNGEGVTKQGKKSLEEKRERKKKAAPDACNKQRWWGRLLKHPDRSKTED